jgi:hypothetical protein
VDGGQRRRRRLVRQPRLLHEALRRALRHPDKQVRLQAEIALP